MISRQHTESTITLHGSVHGAPAFAMPEHACDCHTHIFGPAQKFPFAPDRLYTPGDASVAELLAHQTHLGLDRVVIVHPSPYGTDNACTLDALRQLGDRSRGVAVIDEIITDAQLDDMHDAGVRGIRLNLETKGIADPAYAAGRLKWAEERVARLGWHVQIFTNLAMLASLHDVIERLSVPLVIDHFGRAQAALGSGQLHFDVMLDMIRQGGVWVKLSAPYRISTEPDWVDAGVIARALIAANPDRMVWGSDWPHPGGRSRGADTVGKIEPFQSVNDGRALDLLAQWADDDATLARILVDNPAILYDFEKK